MAAVAKQPSAQLSVEYDRNADVLYIAIGKPRSAEGEDGPGGVIYRYAIDDNAACGVTIVGFRRNGWHENATRLAALIANHLNAKAGQIETMICRSTAARVKSH